jgi:hypothetical protein
MVTYGDLLPVIPLSQADRDAMLVALTPTWGAAAPNQAEINAVWTAITAFGEARRQEAQQTAFYDLGYKILATGMKNASLAAKVRNEERQRKPYGEIMAFLEREEANLSGTTKPVDNAAPKTLLPTKVNEVNDGEDAEYEAAIEEVKSRFKKGGYGNGTKPKKANGNGKGKPKPQPQQQAAQQQAPQTSGYQGKTPKYVKDPNAIGFGLPCHMCKKVGHWQRDCPEAAEFAAFKAKKAGGNIHVTSNPNRQQQARQQQQPDTDLQYQQYLEFQARGNVGQIHAGPFRGPAYEQIQGSGKGQAGMQ